MMNDVATTPAGKRIEALLDEKSFVEIGRRVTARSTDFGLASEKAEGDGVITGYGFIDGHPVYVYAQDASVLGGSLGEMHAKKITSLYRLAIKTGTPVIALLDSAGFRLQESTDALEAAGSIYAQMAEASGLILQISVVFGTCGGGMALVPALSDFTFMEEAASLFVNAPNTLNGNTKEKEDTSSAAYQSEKAGTVDGVGSQEALFAKVRKLLSVLPANFEETAAEEAPADDLNRKITNAAALAEDPSALLAAVSDNGFLLEKAPEFAKDMVCGFIRLNGITVGALANRTAGVDKEGNKEAFNGCLSGKGAKKAAAFVSFCDAFQIPLLTVTNVNGYETSRDAESCLMSHLGTLAVKMAQATVPRVNLITQKAMGSAYVLMNAKGMGADVTFAWENAQIGAMEANMAAKVLCDGADAKELKAKEEEIKALQNNVASAAARGYVDTVISPEDTRKYLAGAFEMLYPKRDEETHCKHSAK